VSGVSWLSRRRLILVMCVGFCRVVWICCGLSSVVVLMMVVLWLVFVWIRSWFVIC